MFGSKKGGKPPKSEASQITTSIGEECVFEGNISTSSSTRIDGTLKGKIVGENIIIVGERGMISGEVKAVETIVFGKVEGTIESERLEIKSTGKVTGDIFINALIVEDGGAYNGRCTMDVGTPKILSQAPQETSKESSSGAIELETKTARAKEL